MKTSHKIIFKSSMDMGCLPAESIDLMVTSPPYPMITMWDEIFTKQNPDIGNALKNNDEKLAFELMNKILDNVWDDVYRVLKPGGIACINIGDATRTINSNFKLFNNHTRIINHCLKIGFQTLPEIIWRKQTNAPNKFMGSGMLPPGAYVTLEHEFILIFRKGRKREFKSTEEKKLRQESAYFWEERNNWFSDVWFNVKGAWQGIEDKNVRKRSAAYPFEIPYRLINMFSVKDDVVLDPFLGTGTTSLAAMASERNSIGFELDENFKEILEHRINSIVELANGYIDERLIRHIMFVKEKFNNNGTLKGKNTNYEFPCTSGQEASLLIRSLKSVNEIEKNHFEVKYHENPQKNICNLWKEVPENTKIEQDFTTTDTLLL